MKESFKLPNLSGELLDCLIEGNGQAEKIIIFVHGFGTDKHEHGLFDDLSKSCSPNHSTLRFDFSGYGHSQGHQTEVDYLKQTKDLHTILDWANKSYPGKTKNILAMSMGCYITAMLKPRNISKTVLLSVPHQDTSKLKSAIKKRILSKGGTINESAISHYPRSHGEAQQIGPTFWQEMNHLNPLQEIQALAQITNLLLIHPLQDEIVPTQDVQKYKTVQSAQYLELPGNHSWTNLNQRRKLIHSINEFLNT